MVGGIMYAFAGDRHGTNVLWRRLLEVFPPMSQDCNLGPGGRGELKDNPTLSMLTNAISMLKPLAA